MPIAQLKSPPCRPGKWLEIGPVEAGYAVAALIHISAATMPAIWAMTAGQCMPPLRQYSPSREDRSDSEWYLRPRSSQSVSRMLNQADSQTTMYSRNPAKSLLKFPWNRMRPVTTAHTTVSMMTAPHRLTGTPSACSVTPEEYMSMVLIARSWKIAKIRNGVTNQDGNDWGTPIWVIPTKLFCVTVKANTPSSSRRIDGIAPPRDAAQNVRDWGVRRGR